MCKLRHKVVTSESVTTHMLSFDYLYYIDEWVACVSCVTCEYVTKHMPTYDVTAHMFTYEYTYYIYEWFACESRVVYELVTAHIPELCVIVQRRFDLQV